MYGRFESPGSSGENIEEPCGEVKKAKLPVCYFGGSIVKMHP